MMREEGIDKCKLLTLQFQLTVETLHLRMLEKELMKVEVEGQAYTEVSLMRIIVLMD